MEVATKEEHEILAYQVADLKALLGALQNQLNTRPQPKTWVVASEARKCFIGRNNKPVDRHTFNAMQRRWLQNGTLVQGVNYKDDGVLKFFTVEFLAGAPAPKHKLVVTHLQKTA